MASDQDVSDTNVELVEFGTPAYRLDHDAICLPKIRDCSGAIAVARSLCFLRQTYELLVKIQAFINIFFLEEYARIFVIIVYVAKLLKISSLRHGIVTNYNAV